MNRRTALKLLFSTPFLSTQSFNWKTSPLIFNPSPKQLEFFGRALDEDVIKFFGIPYHYDTSTTGPWLGISRNK